MKKTQKLKNTLFPGTLVSPAVAVCEWEHIQTKLGVKGHIGVKRGQSQYTPHLPWVSGSSDQV